MRQSYNSWYQVSLVSPDEREESTVYGEIDQSAVCEDFFFLCALPLPPPLPAPDPLVFPLGWLSDPAPDAVAGLPAASSPPVLFRLSLLFEDEEDPVAMERVLLCLL